VQVYLLLDNQKNATYIKKLNIYDENEGPVRTRMLEVIITDSVYYAFQ
jgi:hypothetical protein